MCRQAGDDVGGSTPIRHGGAMTKKIEPKENGLSVQYDSILGDISNLIDGARRSAARSVNCVMTAAYWLIGKQTDSPDTVWRI